MTKSSRQSPESSIEPLVVRPKTAARLLDRGLTKIHEDIASGRLESFRDGAARKITMRSIKRLIETELEAERDPNAPSPTAAATAARMRKRAAASANAEAGTHTMDEQHDEPTSTSTRGPAYKKLTRLRAGARVI